MQKLYVGLHGMRDYDFIDAIYKDIKDDLSIELD